MKKFLIKLGFLSSSLLVIAAQADTTNPLGTTLNTTLQDDVNGTVITNLGTISTGGAVSISSTGNNVSIINRGSLSSDNAAIVTGGTNVNILNAGTLTISQGGNGMYITGANTTITNTGRIIGNDPGMSTYGIYIFGTNNTVINYGTFEGSSPVVAQADTTILNYGTMSGMGGGTAINYGHATYIGSTIKAINYGTITATGDYNWGSAGNVTNYGTITTNGTEGLLMGLGHGSAGYNYGEMTSYGGARSSVQIESGTGTVFLNAGTLKTYGASAFGVYVIANLSVDRNFDNTIVNSGSIITYGNLAHAITFWGTDSNTLTNSGVIKAYGVNANAIDVRNNGRDSNNNTININRGSVIVGDIYADSNVIGSRLNINFGAGVSYAYSVTGPWTVTDLDNRPMVTGSAYAAGIGAQETASEMLYQRTSAITSSLDRRLRSYAADEVDNQPYWLDIYYSDVSRNSGGNYSTQTAFSNYNYGITAGFKLLNEITPLELIVNVAQSNLNIDSGNQKIDSTSLMTGLLAPDLADVLGAKLSAKAMVGYADHDGDRKVMTNSLLYDGSRQIKSD